MKIVTRLVLVSSMVALGVSGGVAATQQLGPNQRPTAAKASASTTSSTTSINLKDNTLLTNRMMMVTTTPYLGIRSDYQAGDLLINLPTMNQDLVLLQQQQQLENTFNAAGVPFATRPIVQLSGALAAQAAIGETYNGGTSSVNLSTAELEINTIISKWANAFFDIDYDKNAAPYTNDVSKVDNSRLYLERGFLTIGNLNRSPVYGSVGQMYVPFGHYGSYLVGTPLTDLLAKTTARALSVGYVQGAFNGQAYVYQGDTYIHSANRTINEAGADVNYKFDLNRSGNLTSGVGLISNLADSNTFRDNGVRTTSTFQGFTRTTGTQQLEHRVPASDIYGVWTNGPYGLTAEFIHACRKFAAQDLQYSSKGAKPAALHTEASYKTNVMNKTVTFAASLGETWQAAAANLPQYTAAVGAVTSLMKNTIEGIEFRHNVNYSRVRYDNSTGGNTALTPYLGRTSNIVTAQVGVYF